MGGLGAVIATGYGINQIGLRQLTATPQPTAAATLASLSATATALPACVVRPELTEGPYFVDEMLNRSDVRSDPSDGSVRPGVPLAVCQPYSSRGKRSMLNAQDGIYQNGGSQLLLQPTKQDDGSYAATFDIGLQLT